MTPALLLLLGLLAVVGFFRILMAVVKTAASIRRLTKRNLRPKLEPLKDDLPTECSECGLIGDILVARADYKPDGETFKLANVEHFRCDACDHHWLGPNQQADVAKRVLVRRKLRVALPPKAIDQAVDRAKAKLAELDRLTKP